VSILHAVVHKSINRVHLHIIISLFVSWPTELFHMKSFSYLFSTIRYIHYLSLYFHIRHIFFPFTSSLMQLWRFIILFIYTLIHSFPFSFLFIYFYDLLHVFMTLDMRIDEKEMNISVESWKLYNLVFLTIPSSFLIPFDLLFDGNIFFFKKRNIFIKCL